MYASKISKLGGVDTALNSPKFDEVVGQAEGSYGRDSLLNVVKVANRLELAERQDWETKDGVGRIQAGKFRPSGNNIGRWTVLQIHVNSTNRKFQHRARIGFHSADDTHISGSSPVYALNSQSEECFGADGADAKAIYVRCRSPNTKSIRSDGDDDHWNVRRTRFLVT